MSDTFHQDWLADLEVEVAALVRQYLRATEASDRAAREVEADAICDRIRRLLYHHLGLSVSDTDDDWFWLDGQEEGCRVELVGAMELKATGRLWCSLPEGRRQWTEPFAARVAHSATAQVLSGYTLHLGSRETLLNLSETRRQIEGGRIPTPPPPANEEEWAFVFRLGDRS